MLKKQRYIKYLYSESNIGLVPMQKHFAGAGGFSRLVY